MRGLNVTRCPYQGCKSPALDVDADGRSACSLHAAQSGRYEVTVFDLDPKQGKAVTASLQAQGWDLKVRRTRSGEPEGVLERRSDGPDIWLGTVSMPIPQVLREALAAHGVGV